MPAILYVPVNNWSRWWEEHVDVLSADVRAGWQATGDYEIYNAPLRLKCGAAVHIQYVRKLPNVVEILFDSDEAATFYALGGTSLTS